MYKEKVISPEAARDIVEEIFDNPKRKFVNAKITTHSLDSDDKQFLTLEYTIQGLLYIPEDRSTFSVLEMPINNVLELLKFAMSTVTDVDQLIQGYKE